MANGAQTHWRPGLFLLPLLFGLASPCVHAYPSARDGGSQEARSFLDYGKTFARDAQWRAAIELYRNALDLDPRLADAHFLMGVAFAQQERPRESVHALRRATELDPRSARSFYNLGVAYAHTGEIEKEIAAYKEAIRLDPSHASAHYNLATAYWSQGRDRLASQYLFEAGRLYLKGGRPDQAREMLHLIQRIAPDSELRSRLARLIRQ